jgi:hypothetical protein
LAAISIDSLTISLEFRSLDFRLLVLLALLHVAFLLFLLLLEIIPQLVVPEQSDAVVPTNIAFQLQVHVHEVTVIME